jgi:hypothetical protein
MTGKDQYVHEEIKRMRHTEFSCFDVIIDAASVQLNRVQVGFLYITTDIVEEPMSGPDIVMDVREDLLDHRSIIIEMVCILQVSRHHEIIFFCEQVQSLERVLHIRLSYYFLHELFYTIVNQK